MENNVQPENKRGSKKFVSLVLFIIIFSAIAFFAWTQYVRWYEERRIYIESGLASDKFPFRIYTDDELRAKGLVPLEK